MSSDLREMTMNRFSHLLSVVASACLMALAGCSGVADSKATVGAGQPEETVVRPFDPTSARVATPSKSLSMAPGWTPPAPTRTGTAKLKARVQPTRHWGVPTRNVGPNPSDAEIGAVSFMPERLRAVPGTSTAEETKALAAALREEWRDERRLAALGRFLDAYPASRWAPALHLNLGKISYDLGYFQDALAHWRAGWELAKGGEDQLSQDIANLALAESAKMNARIGRQAEVEALLAEAEKRKLLGDARIKIESAAEGAWMMRHRPGISFRCGPYALLNVAREQKLEAARKTVAFLEKTQSPRSGFSIPEVHRMSAELGLKLQIAKRQVGAPVVLPAVVHWKLGHFAAVVRETNGKLLLKDPTFGEDMWITASVLDREASGYFLVPVGSLPSGWSRASTAETAHLYGKGFTSTIKDDTAEWDHKVGGSCQSGLAMATYQFHTLAASLHIEDTPVGYSAAMGPDVRVKVAYNQREAGQPLSMDFTNFGPQFVSNWVSYGSSGTFIYLMAAGGGSVSVSKIAIPGTFPGNPRRGEIFTTLANDGFKLTFPDGREEYYEHVVGAIEDGPPRAFLSRRVDPQGNEATIEYDAAPYETRIHQIVDATGLPTVFHYAYPGEPYLVTSIEDPYGRTATFAYVLAAGKVRLQSIEDVHGIVSSFTYNEDGEIVAMTTPYGTTTFKVSGPYEYTGENLFRYVEATDPAGETERVEFNIGAETGVPSALPPPVPDVSVVKWTIYNNYRNSFYWDKLQMRLAPRDYRKAHIYHWLHYNANMVTSILESEVSPLEGRIFYNYPGQSTPEQVGSLGFPSVVGRVVKDASGNNKTQATRIVYNDKANVSAVTDPVGRETVLEYDANGIDVVAVKQKTGPTSWTTTSSVTYGGGAPAHRPATETDGAGNTTTYTYSSTGQVQTITNAKSEVTTFTYETNPSSPAFGRLLTITGDVPGGNRTFTYDAFGRLRTSTDSEGYALTFDYDTLDRLRTVTYPDGTYEQSDYEDHSLVASRDRGGRWTRHMYNSLMQRVLTQDPALRTTQFQWCRCGGLKRFVDGNGNVTEWQRDEASRVTKKIHANGTFDAYTYDFSGRLSTEVDAMSRTVTYAYGVDDRLAKKDYSDAATPDVTYAYDAWFPRLTSRVDGSGTTTFAYHPYGASANGAGQVALVNGPLANDTLKHTYDQLGRLKKLEIVDDATQTTPSYSEEYTFDSRSRVTNVVNNLGSTNYAFVGQSNRPSTVDYPNGMQTQLEYFASTGNFALKQIKNLTSGLTPAVISQFDYTYEPDRRISTWTIDQGSGAKTWSFAYDDARQLTSASLRDAAQALLESTTYGYDRAGNRIQVRPGTMAPNNYATNELNQLSSQGDDGPTTFAGVIDEPATVTVNSKPAKVVSTDGGAPFKFEALVNLAPGANSVVVEAKDGQNNTATKTYSVTTAGTSKRYGYDANGNLRYERLANNAPLREYRWDQQNRLVKELHGTHESAYEYDGASRRVKITEKEHGVQTKQETFVWCGSRICQKRSGATVVRSYFGNGFEEGTADYFYTRDHLGSVREVVDATGATVASRLSYDPWGKVTESGDVIGGALSDFTYTGHYFDRPTGLNLAQYRAYDAQLGRWLSRDPIGLRGGPNVYGYVRNNPVNGIDPLGLDTLDDLSEFERLGGLDYLAGFGIGLLDTVPLYAGLPGSPTLGDVSKSAGLGGKHRCSASGGDPASQGERDGAIAAVAAGGVAALAEAAPNLFKLLNCVACRNAIVGVLKGLNISGQVLEVRANGNAQWIVSDLFSGGTPISENGYHTAVQVGETVFDNLNPAGVARTVWEGALQAPFGVTITATPF